MVTPTLEFRFFGHRKRKAFKDLFFQFQQIEIQRVDFGPDYTPANHSRVIFWPTR